MNEQIKITASKIVKRQKKLDYSTSKVEVLTVAEHDVLRACLAYVLEHDVERFVATFLSRVLLRTNTSRLISVTSEGD